MSTHDPAYDRTADVPTLVGLADLCELMAATFRFPDEALAQALADGAYAHDARTCLADAGADPACVRDALAPLAAYEGRDEGELLGELRRAHSVLFLAPGTDVPAWPYEAALRFVAEGREGAPSLMHSPIAADVQAQMRAAGVEPERARTEPPDSVWDELAFLSFALGSAARALHEGDRAGAQLWLGRARRFWETHAGLWMPAFARTARQQAAAREHGRAYEALAGLLEAALATLATSLGTEGGVRDGAQ